MGFTKLDERILQSSIMAEDGITFKVWIALLASCESSGIAYVSPLYLAAICHAKINKIEEALKKLEGPDPNSRSLGDRGRRISRIDGGFAVLNYKKYRFYDYQISPEENQRRAAWQRGDVPSEGYVYFIRAGERIKIGFSKNPWGRLSEIKSSNLDAEMIGVFPGTLEDEAAMHKKFHLFHISREWFRGEAAFMDMALDVLKTRDGRMRDTTTNLPVSVATKDTTEIDSSREDELRRSSVVSASASASESDSSSGEGKSAGKPRPPKIVLNLDSWAWENITEADMGLWAEAYPAVDIKIALRQMAAWCKDHQSDGKGRKSNWSAFISRWLKKEQDRGGTRNGVKPDRLAGLKEWADQKGVK